MKLTEYYKLRKPEGTDPIDVTDLNDNADIIDSELANKLDKIGVATDLVTAFSQASTRSNLSSGEKISISFGKIAKWFADLGTAAFKGVSNTLGITADGYVLDARAGKELNDKFGGMRFYEDASGKYVVGADTVPKKLGSVVDGLINDGRIIGGSSLYLAPSGVSATTHELAWDSSTQSPKALETGDYLVTMGFLYANGKFEMDIAKEGGSVYPSTPIGIAGNMTVRAFVLHVDAPVKLYARFTVVGNVPQYGTVFGYHTTIKLDN